MPDAKWWDAVRKSRDQDGLEYEGGVQLGIRISPDGRTMAVGIDAEFLDKTFIIPFEPAAARCFARDLESAADLIERNRERKPS